MIDITGIAGAAAAVISAGSVSGFNVTADVLKERSSDLTKRVNQMRRYFEELQEEINNTSGYWVGEAGDKHRQMYNDLKGDIEDILRRLGEHPNDLLKIAQNYMDVEISVTEDIETLPGDVIV